MPRSLLLDVPLLSCLPHPRQRRPRTTRQCLSERVVWEGRKVRDGLLHATLIRENRIELVAQGFEIFLEGTIEMKNDVAFIVETLRLAVLIWRVRHFAYGFDKI